MPGFRLYLISLLLCQHFYLLANAGERNIPLAAVTADFSVTTGEDWILTSVSGVFTLVLAAADGPGVAVRVGDADLAYIQERMNACPVSKNLPAGVAKIISLRLEPAADA